MPFPRFNSGSFGNLTFKVMNELFSRVEALEAKQSPLPKPVIDNRPFLAELKAQQPGFPGVWEFIEVAPTPAWTETNPQYKEVRGGRQSSNDTDKYAYPALGEGFVAGDYALLVPGNREDGVPTKSRYKGCFRAIPLKLGSQSIAMGSIVSSAVVIADQLWDYTVDRGVDSPFGPGSFVSFGLPPITVRNTVEMIQDFPAVKGVGMVPPSGPTLQRQPLRDGLEVMCFKQPGDTKWYCCVPNGYKVIC